MKIQEQVLLSSYTTFATGGPADYFVEVTNIEDLKGAVSFAKEKGLPFFMLGHGSNLLISDLGYRGVVILCSLKGIAFEKMGSETCVRVAAGEMWDSFVEETVKRNLQGLENLSLIPGRVGGAPVQNIGAYGIEVKDKILSVEVLDTESMSSKVLTREECNFTYRGSIFKTESGRRYVVTHVNFLLYENGQTDISYKDVKEYFDKKGINTPNLKDVREAICYIRTNKLPDWHKYPTAGSFFKNPFISTEHFKVIQSKYPLIPSFSLANNLIKIPAAWVLDNVLHLKGFREGNVGLYEKQPLAIVNHGGATSTEIKNFSDLISKKFFEATDIKLEREVEFVGVF